MNLLQQVEAQQVENKKIDFPTFRSGDSLAVHVRIKEGNKERIQVFKGTCIAVKQFGQLNGHFRVRKMSDNVGVERVFPFFSPNIAKIEVVSLGKTRRAKHYYLRDRTGKAARIAVDYDRSN